MSISEDDFSNAKEDFSGRQEVKSVERGAATSLTPLLDGQVNGTTPAVDPHPSIFRQSGHLPRSRFVVDTIYRE